MTIKAQQVTIFNDLFNKSIAESKQPEWLKVLRNRAFSYFQENGLPTTRDEEWKYTDITAIGSGQWSVGSGSESVSGEPAAVSGEHKVVLVNGVLNDGLTSLKNLPEGIRVLSFADSFEDGTFKKFFTKCVDFDFNSLTALSTAFAENGIFIHVSKDVKIDGPVHVVCVGESETANFPRILFVGETGSEAEIVEHYTRLSDAEYFTNTVTEVFLEENARLKHTRVQRESHQAVHIGTSKAVLERDAVYDTTNINLGAKLSRHDANLEFRGEGGEAWVDGLYLVEDGQHMDTHSRLDHTVKNCISHQNYKGILDGKSRAVFNGKVFVHKDASGTDAEQSNKNLLLSNDARVDTKPQLEIFNDDVKCAHGATVGQLEEEELFYLLSRGLSQDLARNLLTYGFAEEIINKIEIPEIKEQLDEAVLSRLHARL